MKIQVARRGRAFLALILLALLLESIAPDSAASSSSPSPSSPSSSNVSDGQCGPNDADDNGTCSGGGSGPSAADSSDSSSEADAVSSRHLISDAKGEGEGKDEDDPSCRDEREKCPEWAEEGECLPNANPTFMLDKCRKSCGVCGGFEEEVVPAEKDGSSCVDKHEKCGEWSDIGECEKNPTYMLTSCRKSCGSCAASVTKDTDFGEPQNVEGEQAPLTRFVLRESVKYMRKVLTDPEYASVRAGCRNQHRDCAFWAAIGECKKNAGYMEVSCSPSCLSCEQIDIRKRCPLDPDAVDALYPGDLNRMFERITAEGSESAWYKPNVLSRPRREGDDPDNVEDGPWVVTFDEFLSEEECNRLIYYGREKGYERSQDVGKMRPDGTHDGLVSNARTSLNAWCNETCYGDPVVANVLKRIADVTGVPEENSEDLQLLEYSVGQHYVQHHDYIGYQTERPCGVRILTFFLYLNDVEAGGGTRFPDLDLTVMPKRGKALLWPSVLDESPSSKDKRTDHEALAVESGMKYGANAWLHLRNFRQALKDNCHN